MGMTIAEKVLAAHSGKQEVRPGEYVWGKVDGTAILGHGLLLKTPGSVGCGAPLQP